MEQLDNSLFEAVEKKFGSARNAAEAAGVTYTTWWRWRTGKTTMRPRIKATLELLTSHPVVDGNERRRETP